MTARSVTLMANCKLALYLLLWYGSSTWNGISSKNLFRATALHASPLAIILQVIVLSVAELLVTSIGGIGASQVVDGIVACKEDRERPQLRIFQIVLRSISSKQWVKLVIIVAFLNLLGVFSTNLSFYLGGVSITHLIKSSEPVIVSAYSCAISTEPDLSLNQLAGMLLITFGIAIASYNNIRSTFNGILAALISSLLLPLRNVLIKKMTKNPKLSKTSNDEISLNGIQLFFVVSFVSFILGGFFILCTILASPAIRVLCVGQMLAVFTGPACIDAVMAIVTFSLYNSFSMIVLQHFFVSTHAILNILKRGIVILASAVLIDKNFNQYLIIGTGIAMMGLWLFRT